VPERATAHARERLKELAAWRGLGDVAKLAAHRPALRTVRFVTGTGLLYAITSKGIVHGIANAAAYSAIASRVKRIRLYLLMASLPRNWLLKDLTDGQSCSWRGLERPIKTRAEHSVHLTFTMLIAG
jgi:hypothetical protein